MQCLRGWILCQNDKGFNVPFFVKVRSCDVLYSSTIANKFYDNQVLSEEQIKKIQILPASTSYMLEHDGWVIRLQNNEMFTAYKRFPAPDFRYDYAREQLTMRIDFPFKVDASGIREVHVQKECQLKTLKLAAWNVVFDEPDPTKTDHETEIYGCNLEFFKHDGAVFTYPELQSVEYQDSYIGVTITAFADCGKYAHQDEGSQIGAEWESVPSGGSMGVGGKDVYTKAEVRKMLEDLKSEISSGALLDPQDFIQLIDDPTDASVMHGGYILDIEEEDPESVVMMTNLEVSETDEIEEKIQDADVVNIDISDLI